MNCDSILVVYVVYIPYHKAVLFVLPFYSMVANPERG